MYNMDIVILGYKFNIQHLILIGVVYLILVGHTCLGCSSFGMMEGFDVSENSSNREYIKKKQQSANLKTQVAAGVDDQTYDGTNAAGKEGFTGANINLGNSSPYDLTKNPTINTASWSSPNMTIVKGQPLSEGVKQIFGRPAQQVPLPKDEMLIFANTQFKPECCPNTYSTGSGCACATMEQYNWLKTRGGNNAPYSQY